MSPEDLILKELSVKLAEAIALITLTITMKSSRLLQNSVVGCDTRNLAE